MVLLCIADPLVAEHPILPGGVSVAQTRLPFLGASHSHSQRTPISAFDITSNWVYTDDDRTEGRTCSLYILRAASCVGISSFLDALRVVVCGKGLTVTPPGENVYIHTHASVY